MKQHQLEVLAPISGVLVPLGEVPDPAFATESVGDGIAIDPVTSVLLAPVDGTVIHLHRAKHALILRADEGPELLLHIGLDTVTLNGEGFEPQVRQGDHVLAGQPLIAFEPELLGRKARSLLTLVVFPNGDRVCPCLPAYGLVTGGKDVILEADLKTEAAAAPSPGGPSSPGGPAESHPILLPNAQGLHARPAAALATLAKTYLSTITLVKGTEEANAKSAVAIMGLGTAQGDVLRLRASGSDAHSALGVLAEFLEDGCGEKTAPAPAPLPVSPARVATVGLGGVPASPGLAVGRIFQFRPVLPQIAEEGGNPSHEMSHLESALREAWGRIDALKAQTDSGHPDHVGILAAHQELLADPDLARIAFDWIAKGRSAAWAWDAATRSQAAKLEDLASPLLRERARDLHDVGRRVVALILDSAQVALDPPQDSILVAEELMPSEAAQLDPGKVRGLCTALGGPTSHVAILARSLGIPAVCGMDPAALAIPDGTLAVLDGTRGDLVPDPAADLLAQVQEHERFRAEQRISASEAAHLPALTADGFPLEVAANVRDAQDAARALASGAAGVGLLRSEFLFQDRFEAPSEDEQAAAYAAVARELGPSRKLVIRTLDVGGDKPLAYLPLPQESNPFLGMRGLRVSLDRPALFRIQLRALLQVAPLTDLHVLFPMVTSLEELLQAKAILKEEAASIPGRVQVGVMIEVPAAALTADALAREVDFFSIGTNDLTQYCMAMDRGHPRLAKQADALHPSVLKLVSMTVEAAHRHGKWVGVCGGLASDPLALPALLGLGVDEISVDVPVIGTLKSHLAGLGRTECAALAQELLRLGTATEVRNRLSCVPAPSPRSIPCH